MATALTLGDVPSHVFCLSEVALVVLGGWAVTVTVTLILAPQVCSIESPLYCSKRSPYTGTYPAYAGGVGKL
jgi:hypothetical protein